MIKSFSPSLAFKLNRKPVGWTVTDSKGKIVDFGSPIEMHLASLEGNDGSA